MSITRRQRVARPAFVTDEHLTYLDKHRRTGVTHMLDAGPKLAKHFDLPRKVALQICVYWVQSFDERHPQ